MNGNICRKTIFKATGIAIFAVLFYTSCDDNGVKVVTPEVTTFEDVRDGKVYKKVKIGSQIWMAENLRYEADGSVCYEDSAPVLRDSAGVVKLVTQEEHCDYYGRLYDWNTAMDGVGSSHANPSGVEGVCPVGWHIPSDAEWTELQDFVGLNVGTKLKSREWHDMFTTGGKPAQDGTDKYRFSALPGGMGSQQNGRSSFGGVRSNGYWWSSTERAGNDHEAWIRHITGTQEGVWRQSFDKHQWFLSVRCVHD